MANAKENFYTEIEGVNVESILRSKEQARLQLDARLTGTPKYELLAIQQEKGLNRLPLPNDGDIFFDIEGDQYYGEAGLEYLWGFSFLEDGKLSYKYQWAHNYREEKASFEWFINFVVERKLIYPELKIYHYSAYEPSALKRLMGRYGVMEEQIDHLLRTNTFVDLYSITRQSVRAGIEKYSIKDLEQFYGYTRLADLRSIGAPKRFVEHCLELNKSNLITAEAREMVRAYNQDDTDSTYYLRQWLEQLRVSCEADGVTLTRPQEVEGEVHEELSEALQRLNDIRQSLQEGIDPIAENRSEDQQALWLLGDLVSFYRREDKVNFWEKFRLKELDALELLEDKSGLSGLTFLATVGGTKKCPIDRYKFMSQSVEIKKGADLFKEGHLQDEKVIAFGSVENIDYENSTVDIKKRAVASEFHPNACWAWKHIDKTEKTNRMLEFAEFVIENSIDSPDKKYRAARDILRGQNPRFINPIDLNQEDTLKLAKEMALNLDHSYLAIQGPPGTGKSYTASRVIMDLLKNGFRVGVTGLSHKVISNLMNKISQALIKSDLQFNLFQKTNPEDQNNPEIQYVGKKKGDLSDVLDQAGPWVLGGTDFMWSGSDFKDRVDYLVVDEAGQFSLVGIMSIAHATKNIILLGDGAQLKQPIQGSHPEGCEVSALAHIVGEGQTIAKEKGVFLPITYRLHPAICAFNSELFYESRLRAIDGNEKQIIKGPSKFAGQALAVENVEHWGNTSTSIEEVRRIQEIVKDLCDGNHTYTLWQDNRCVTKTVTIESIMVVAPYNAQVNRIKQEIPDINVGTVDKFQGQEAPIVIYSVTTSSPEDAPRGMEFLYSGNRLNVAVSRAECLFIMLGSSKIFEPNCQRPFQMKLANAFCRLLEMAQRTRR